jgi:hypothetical protein
MSWTRKKIKYCSERKTGSRKEVIAGNWWKGGSGCVNLNTLAALLGIDTYVTQNHEMSRVAHLRKVRKREKYKKF